MTTNYHVVQKKEPHFNYAAFNTNILSFPYNPAFTEASFVSCQSTAFTTTVRRLSQESQAYWGGSEDEFDDCSWSSVAMDFDANSASLQRSASHHSNASTKSSRSQTVRSKSRRYASYMSSSTSSISDKSLTSFPSFSPESPKIERPSFPPIENNTPRKPSDPAPSIVESLTTSAPLNEERNALFDDAPLSTRHVPGSIHRASDEHIERLIARNGAVTLVRQLAEDLAQRDAQMAALRRKAENRERTLKKIILECGLSTLDMETRLRAIEAERPSDNSRDLITEGGLEDLMSDAMSETVILGERAFVDNDATIRARDALKALDSRTGTVQKGWKDYLWGGTSKKSSRASSVNGEAVNGLETADTKNNASNGRRTVLQSDIFQPLDSPSSTSQTPAAGTSTRDRKPSSGLASLALKLVAGSSTAARDAEGLNGRGRANSTGNTPAARAQSSASANTTMSGRSAPPKPSARSIPGPRRTVGSVGQNGPLRATQDRWDTMGQSPQKNGSPSGVENYGPVEMDQILPFEAQPPTVTQNYNTYNQEFLTDRFGFIYDQRRKKRQREAAEKIRKSKRSSRSRLEMLSGARNGLGDDELEVEEDRPETPTSIESRSEDGKPVKRWQDYLKIATFPTELLSHTPSGAVPAFEVMEGGEVHAPRSPGIFTTEERGFVPTSSTVAAQSAVPVTSDNATILKSEPSTPPKAELTTEDTEPVKLLLQQLGEVHDSLQREKTVRWNDFLRKVRAERKRDGEAAAAALAATADKSTRPLAVMPEASLTDGELIGVAGLGNKGKVGRAKWNEFKSLVLGGIPVTQRAKIWAECSGAAALRIPGYYEDLVHHEGNDDPAIVAQIQMDINRTLTDNIFFRKGPGVAKLNEVLLAYSRRNEEVGYCQGMNLITACLLLIMPTAEDAFWLLTSIIENILPRGYYDHSLLASRADQQVLRQYVAEILPRLSTHLDELSIELEALTFQWFLSVFTDCLSAEALFRVWDVVFCTNDGSTFLFQVALALLKLNESQLLQCSTPAGVYTYINHQMTNHAISIDGLIHASEGLRKVVKRDEIETRRARAIEAEKDLIRQREARNNLWKAERAAAANKGVAETVKQASKPPSLGSRTPSLKSQASQAEIGEGEAYGELTVRTPIPMDEERDMSLG